MTTPPNEGGPICPACGDTGSIRNEAWDLFEQWAAEAFGVDVITCPADQAQAIARRFESTFGPQQHLCPICKPYPQNTP
ncbi:hypothetical protein ACQ4N7_23300 [Nodosilinea sp. AN01ver1]|uniref:hypothetical protein n=1 Tax=Nodosilinea sp. AN01ver1 TaxID=3423362 RepID=UPI003D315A78